MDNKKEGLDVSQISRDIENLKSRIQLVVEDIELVQYSLENFDTKRTKVYLGNAKVLAQGIEQDLKAAYLKATAMRTAIASKYREFINEKND